MAIATISAIQGVTPPALGAIPVSAITPNVEYTGTVAWLPADETFKWQEDYTATITLVPEGDTTFTGVTANFFTVEGAISVTNDADSGVVTAVFATIDFDRITGAKALALLATLSPVIQTRYANLCIMRGFELQDNGNVLRTAELELLMDSI